jgi:hypothetical protein
MKVMNLKAKMYRFQSSIYSKIFALKNGEWLKGGVERSGFDRGDLEVRSAAASSAADGDFWERKLCHLMWRCRADSIGMYAQIQEARGW